MKYGPNIPSSNYNDEYKVQKCPKCLNEENDPDADFCIMCGTSLTNVCDGEESDYDDGRIYRHSNPANARFCRLCGKPTAYSRLPILPPYQVQLRIQARQDALRHELAEMDIDEDLFWKMNGMDEDEENYPAEDIEVNTPIVGQETAFDLEDDGELPF